MKIVNGVYVLQWYDHLFWSELKKNDSGILHKLAVCRETFRLIKEMVIKKLNI